MVLVGFFSGRRKRAGGDVFWRSKVATRLSTSILLVWFDLMSIYSKTHRKTSEMLSGYFFPRPTNQPRLP